MQARQKMLRYVLIPERLDLVLAETLRLPFENQRLINEIHSLDEECACPSRGVEDLHECLTRPGALRYFHILVALGDLAPGRGVSKPVLEAELGAEQLVDRAYDVGDDRAGCVEDTSLNLLLPVV